MTIHGTQSFYTKILPLCSFTDLSVRGLTGTTPTFNDATLLTLFNSTILQSLR